VFERAKTVHGLDRSAIVIGGAQLTPLNVNAKKHISLFSEWKNKTAVVP
jgi:hypothetical protein